MCFTKLVFKIRDCSLGPKKTSKKKKKNRGRVRRPRITSYNLRFISCRFLQAVNHNLVEHFEFPVCGCIILLMDEVVVCVTVAGRRVSGDKHMINTPFRSNEMIHGTNLQHHEYFTAAAAIECHFWERSVKRGQGVKCYNDKTPLSHLLKVHSVRLMWSFSCKKKKNTDYIPVKFLLEYNHMKVIICWGFFLLLLYESSNQSEGGRHQWSTEKLPKGATARRATRQIILI